MRILSLCFYCITFFFATAALAKPTPLPLDGIAAVVNDTIITKSELGQQVRLIEQQMSQNAAPTPDRAVLEKQVLEHLILNEVQLQLAKKTGIQIDDPALDNAIESIAKDNQMSVTQLREALHLQGVDFNHYRNSIRHQIMISQLHQRDVLHEVQVSDHEISQFLQSPNGLGGMITEYRLGHILVPLSEAPSPQELENATQKVSKIMAALREGKTFSDVALAESSGEQALKGGDLGWRKLPELPTIFVKAVPNLKVNETPEPIRSASGFHVIKLLDKRTANEEHAVEKTLVRHILVKTNASTSDQDAKQRLNEFRQKIAKGEDFEKLAKAHSADLGSANNGGNLGWISKDVVVPEFSKVMEKLTVADVSEPFQTSFGWHIMQVLGRKAESNNEIALKQKAKEMIQQRKYEEKLQTWARQLRDEAFVITQYDDNNNA